MTLLCNLVSGHGCRGNLGAVLLAVGSFVLVMGTAGLVLGPIIRYYFWRAFVPWSERWLERIFDRWTRYEEYWDPDAPTSTVATPEDAGS